MDADAKAIIEKAEGIAAHGPNIAYVSRVSAEQVRRVVRGLLAIIKDQKFEIDQERELSSILAQRNPE